MKEQSPSTWDIITANEAAKLLHLNVNTLYTIMNTDLTFPAVKIGRKWIIYKAKLPEWFNNKMTCKTQ